MTTTTTVPPIYSVLKKVETVLVLTNGETIIKQDGSDSKDTRNTINSEALDWGPIAPGGTSATKIVFLRVPQSLGIDNIRLGLIDTGGILFSNNVFGVETRSYLDYNIIPWSYFQGVNSEKNAENTYNINMLNNGALKSQYVYLNIVLPENHDFGGGTIRYKWFFDYDSGISGGSGSIGSTGTTTTGIGSSVI